jgi:hypothetical protein
MLLSRWLRCIQNVFVAFKIITLIFLKHIDNKWGYILAILMLVLKRYISLLIGTFVSALNEYILDRIVFGLS